MSHTVRRLGIVLGVFVLVVGAVFVVNQTAQLVLLADRVHPILGSITLWGLLAVYGICIAVPFLLFLRLPSPLIPPDTDDAAEIAKYRERLLSRLKENPVIRSGAPQDGVDLNVALDSLNKHADGVIRQTSSRVFLATAVSQYGSLSALVVLVAQVKMVWDVAHVYHQRPPLRQIATLYANVASTAFVAGRIEDIDITEQVEPVVSSALGSVAGLIPGLQAATDLFVHAVFVGSTNAFLTLRVGVITKRYCAAVVRPERGGLWRSATVEAAGMLRGVVVGGAKRISGAFVSASGRAVGSAARGIGGAVRDAGSSVASRMRFRRGQSTSEDDGGGEAEVGPEGAS